MTTENTNELNNLDNHIINVINQSKKWKKRADVDAILNQIIKKTVSISIDFLAARLNPMLEHNVIQGGRKETLFPTFLHNRKEKI